MICIALPSKYSTCQIFGKVKVGVGIDSDKMETFLDDIISAFDSELRDILVEIYVNFASFKF
ncbi:hypothetical protein [Helicobacter sp. 23-1045]